MSHEPPMTEEARDRSARGQGDEATRPERTPRFELSITRVMAGALAAASAAVAASWLGVAGTVFGAVLASIVVSVSSALYMRPIQHSSRVIRETLPILPVLPERYRYLDGSASASPETLVMSASGDRPDLGDLDDPDELQVAPPADVPAFRREKGRLDWGAVAATSALTLVAGFGILTGVEGLLGQSVSSVTGSDAKHGTTFGQLTKNAPDVTAPADTAPTKPRDTGDSEPVETTPTEPSQTEPTTTQPTTTEPTTTEPSSTQPTPPTTSAPTHATPEPSAAPGTTTL